VPSKHPAQGYQHWEQTPSRHQVLLLKSPVGQISMFADDTKLVHFYYKVNLLVVCTSETETFMQFLFLSY
jgi:hypothetical protein